jgi:hypothetical protein
VLLSAQKTEEKIEKLVRNMIHISADSLQKNTNNDKELRGRGYKYLHKIHVKGMITGQLYTVLRIKISSNFIFIMKTSRQNKKKKKKLYNIQ